MESKFVTLEYCEYLSVYSYWKNKLNPDNHEYYPWRFQWEIIGLEYYASLLDMKRKFKILDNNKWMQHWMLVKINNN